MHTLMHAWLHTYLYADICIPGTDIYTCLPTDIHNLSISEFTDYCISTISRSLYFWKYTNLNIQKSHVCKQTYMYAYIKYEVCM